MNQQPKALISARAKKFIPSQQFVTNFNFKGTQQFTGCFPDHDWLCHPWPPFVEGIMQKRWPRVTKPIMVGKHPVNCCVPLKLKLVTNCWLGINYLALADIRALGC